MNEAHAELANKELLSVGNTIKTATSVMGVQIEITKKAKEIIKSFSEREKAIYELLLNFYHNTAEIIDNCNREIKIYDNKNPRYPLAIKEQMNAEFRLKYMFNCLGIKVYLDYSTLIIHIG